MERIDIVGAGKVGATLGRMFSRMGLQIGAIWSRSLASAERARTMIGAGHVVDALEGLDPADILLVAVSDNALDGIADALAKSSAVGPGTIVFHCSGAVPSSVFAPLRVQGADLASVHPVKTFTDPLRDAESFAGTWCGIEGDRRAVERLSMLFEAAGAHVFPVAGDQKPIYHAASVFLCNYLVPLIEAGIGCYERAGVPRDVAVQAAAPLIRATVENALRLGGAEALTGPIARGDHRVVLQQIRALEATDAQLAELYRVLGLRTVDLAARKGDASVEQLAEIRRLLRE